MRIDEARINHEAMKLIKEAVENPWEYCEISDADAEGCRLIAIGTVYGVVLLADSLKETLTEVGQC